jgi:hypothetical protein
VIKRALPHCPCHQAWLDRRIHKVQLHNYEVVELSNDGIEIANMKHSDFSLGCEFVTATGRWRCTDVGTRTIAAIKLDMDHDPAWYDGPPYAVAESVFDEDGIQGCDPAPRTRIYDDSGRNRIRTVRRGRVCPK